MRAVIRVEVENRKQARDIDAGLRRPDVRTFALVMGVLDQLPSQRAQARVLQFVVDHFSDPDNRPEAIDARAAGQGV